MAQIIVNEAEVLQVTVRETKEKKVYHTAWIFAGGDRPQFFQVNIKSDDLKTQHRMINELDAMTRKGKFMLVLDEFRWEGRSNYSYVGTLQSFVAAANA